MVLKCPHCGNEWRPRISNPKSCPKCKQQFKPGKQPTQITVPTFSDRQTQPTDQMVSDSADTNEIQINDKPGRIYAVCNEDLKAQMDVEAPYIFEGNVVCLYHLIEALIRYDDYHSYKKPDVIGVYKRHRAVLKDALKKVLEGHDSVSPE